MVSTTMLCCWEVRSKGAGWGSMLPGCVWRVEGVEWVAVRCRSGAFGRRRAEEHYIFQI